MKKNYKDSGWRRRFAIIPFTLSNGSDKTFVWLEWYWARCGGIYTEVSLEKPPSL